MSSDKTIKRRIKSATNIQKITKAMEMVAASKMKRAQQSALSSRPYTDKMHQLINSTVNQIKQKVNHYLLKDPRQTHKKGQPFNVLIVLLSTDKSLCGGLNTNLLRGLEKWLENLPKAYSLPKKTKLNFLTIGKKGKEHILKTNKFLVAEFSQLGDRPRFQDIVPINKMIVDGFKKNEYQMVFIAYMKFISTISQQLSVRQLLPIEPGELEKITGAADQKAKSRPIIAGAYESSYLFEPSPQKIFAKLLPQYIELQLYHVILESIASEHSARMVAMKNASDNAHEIVDDLTLQYNQIRQSQITNELLDVTGARMALES